MMKTVPKLICSFLLLFSVVSEAQSKPQPLEIGASAPAFELEGVDGKKHSLQDYSDARLLAVIFTCNHCPTAQAYEQRIKRISEDYDDEKLQVVAISPNDPRALRPDELRYSDLNDTFEGMKIRAQQRNFNFPYLYDGDRQEVSNKYGPAATPHAFLFDRQRKLRYQGAIDDNENPEKVEKNFFRKAIDALLNGEEVPEQTTKVFGCSIKWEKKRKQARKAKEKLAKETASLEKLDLTELKKILKNKQGNVQLFNVWATWCGPCKEEFPDLVEINNIYRSRDFKMYTISIDTMNNRQAVDSFLNEYHASMNNFIVPAGERQKFAGLLDPKWNGPVPHTVIYGPDGEVLYRRTGRFDPLAVKRAIVNELGRTYYE